MTLSPGSRLGPYEIQAPLGAGGMGEVYKARDTRLDRIVAIKVLAVDVAADLELRQRFEREARAVAALNHPHICVVHDIGQHDGIDYLVMEYLEGQTLAERLTKGVLPLDQALRYAIEIADALDKAHRQGITHRDVKPGNVMLTKAGATLLDFGLAKMTATPSSAFAGASALSTQEGLTAHGTIIGTVQYMAPEQLEGKQADARSDLFAFGAVLYEMLTGRKAFEGSSPASLIAAIMSGQPVAITAIDPTAPPALDHIVRTCLEKEPAERFQSAHDLLVDLKWVAETGSRGPMRVTHRGTSNRLVITGAIVAAAALGSLATWWLARPRPIAAPSVARATITLPAKAAFFSSGPFATTNVAISPDGSRVAYVGTAGDLSQLYLRPLDGLEVTPIAGTEGALNPFFSPDGEWIGFFSGGKLKKVRVGGGPPLTICEAAFAFGAAWGDDGTIVFAGGLSGGLSRVPAGAGQPQPLTKLATGEIAHRWPALLPGGREVLFVVGSEVTSWGDGRVAVQPLDSSEHRILLDGGTCPQYAPTGHIVFARGGSLLAVPLERARRGTVGSPTPLLQGVTMDNFSGRAQYALSTNGTLVYVPGGEESVLRALVWVDRHGGMRPLRVPARGFENPRISPDGRQVALTIREGDADIWVLELGRGTLTRLTHEIGEDESPVWTPDGKRVTYSSTRVGRSRVTLWKAADGSGSEEQIFVTDRHQHLGGWTPDGRTLLTEEIAQSGSDLYAATLGEKSVTRAYLQTAFEEKGPQLSPDGLWVAYASNESGHNEVYVQAFPGPGGKWQISADGGGEPMWARSGRELFYRNRDTMMAVDVQTVPTFKAGSPHALFEGPYARVVWGEADYDVSPDGQRFLMVKGEAQPLVTELRLVINWFAELQRLGLSR